MPTDAIPLPDPIPKPTRTLKRYYWSRRPAYGYRILDRKLDTWIAHAEYREAADLIVTALNLQEAHERPTINKRLEAILSPAPGAFAIGPFALSGGKRIDRGPDGDWEDTFTRDDRGLGY